MSRGVNKVIIVGNLGNEPDIRQTQSGANIARISIATAEKWADKASGNLQERTEWHRVVFFGKLADIVGQYLHKGSQVYIEGQLRTNKWQDKNGVERYTTEIMGREMIMLGSGKQQPQSQSTPPQNQNQNQSTQQYNPQPTTPNGSPQVYNAPPQGYDDAAPF